MPGWTASESHGPSDIRRINTDEAGIGKELQRRPYYWRAALNGDVVKDASGSADIA